MHHVLSLPTPPAWVAAIELFLAWLRSSGKPESTVKLYSYRMRRFALDTGVQPFAVTLDDLLTYLGGRDWAPNTYKSARSALRAFYGWAEITGRMNDNPARRLPTVRVPIGVPRPAPEHSIKVGLREADERVQLMIRLGAEAGLRCTEIAQVHTDDVIGDLVGFSLRAHGKGGKERLVPLNGSLAAALRARERGFVFPGRVDGHLSAGRVSKLISAALPPGVTAHPLRHRFASQFYAHERDLLALRELLGHSSVATTQIYTLTPDGVKRRGIEAIGA